jgi:hypothetical protein
MTKVMCLPVKICRIPLSCMSLVSGRIKCLHGLSEGWVYGQNLLRAQLFAFAIDLRQDQPKAHLPCVIDVGRHDGEPEKYRLALFVTPTALAGGPNASFVGDVRPNSGAGNAQSSRCWWIPRRSIDAERHLPSGAARRPRADGTDPHAAKLVSVKVWQLTSKGE